MLFSLIGFDVQTCTIICELFYKYYFCYNSMYVMSLQKILLFMTNSLMTGPIFVM
jgi:hypothetical protein